MSEFINTSDVIGELALVDSILDRSVTEFYDDTVEKIGNYVFNNCKSLTNVNCPNAKSIGTYAFEKCTYLETAIFPIVEEIDKDGLSDCINLSFFDLSSVKTIGGNALFNAYNIDTFNFPSLTYIKDTSFKNCRSLRSLILRSETMCTLTKTNAFDGCCHLLGTIHSTYNPDGLTDGYIYVPKALIEDYKVATNWATFADRFRALEDFTVDGTITGELDENKI
jgi:hypothetical protein